MIGGGNLLYLSVCFEGHNVTIVAADATPTVPIEVECVDINLGQRWAKLDVKSYWIGISLSRMLVMTRF
jgi:hypothetical protein